MGDTNVFPLCLCVGNVDNRLVLTVLSLAAGIRSGDLTGPVRWEITHVYEGSVVSFDWDSRNLNQ